MSTERAPSPQSIAGTTHETFPEIEEGYLPDNALVHFHFAPHIYDYHFEGAQELMEAADAYIPEARGWTYEDLKIFDDAVKGKKQNKVINDFRNEATGRGRRSYNFGQIEGIYEMSKPIPIVFIDGTLKELGPPTLDYEIADPEENFNTTVDRLDEITQKVAAESDRRDSIMARNLGSSVWKLYKQNPDWSERTQVNILSTLGYNHLPLYSYLSQQSNSSENVTASAWIGTGRVNEAGQVTRFYREGKMVPRQLVLRGVLSEVLQFPQASQLLGCSIQVNNAPPYYGGLNEVESFSDTLVDLIATDIEDYPRLQKSVQSLLTGDVRPGYIALLRQYVERAKEASAVT